MTKDEYNLMKAELLVSDPELAKLVDTSLKIQIADRIYKISKYGTFSAIVSSNIDIDKVVADFDTSIMENSKIGEYVQLECGATYIHSFDGPVANTPIPDHRDPVDGSWISLTPKKEPKIFQSYNPKSYKWRNSGAMKYVNNIFGQKDAYEENYFSRTRRVQLNVFSINYGFYASAGVKLKMQKRKRFLCFYYWVNSNADKLAIGFNKFKGKMHYNNPLCYSHIYPSYSVGWGKFKSTINSYVYDFIYGYMTDLPFIEDWVSKIYTILPNVGDFKPSKLEMINKLYGTSTDYMVDLFNNNITSDLYNHIENDIKPKDPKLAYLYWGKSFSNISLQDSYLFGVKEYGKDHKKVIRFDQSFGFTFNNGIFRGMVPTEFKINEIDVMGAAFYDGKWRAVRIYK